MEPESISQLLAGLIITNNSFSKVMPLAAIWLNKPVQTGGKRTVRIEQGEMLRVKGNTIVDISEDAPATHKVIECYGNVANTILYFELEDLHTKELLKLNVK